LAGWGPEVFSFYSQWWIVPVIATHVGAIVGAWMYFLCIEMNWPKDVEFADEEFSKASPGVKSSYIQYPNGRPNEREEEEKKLNPPPEVIPPPPEDTNYRALPTKAAFHDELKKTVNK